MKYVNQPVRKTDAMALVTGKPVYTDDLAPKDCLIVKVLRSPHANAWVEEIKTGNAMKVPGIACILTYKDVPQKRFTLAGQTSPEMSPDDRLIIDRHVRFVGDTVAIVAGETEAAVDKAMKRIKVEYRVEPAVLDIHSHIIDQVFINQPLQYLRVCSVGIQLNRKAFFADCLHQLRKPGAKRWLAAAYADSVNFSFAQVKKFHQSGLGNFFSGSLRRNQLRVVTIRTVKAAARKKHRTGDLSRIIQEGQFLKSGNMHALSPLSDYILFSFLHSGQIPSNTAL